MSQLLPYCAGTTQYHYNSNWKCDESKTNACVRDGERYKYTGDNLYGASLLALSRVAAEYDYALAWVVKEYDAVFVRGDLVCTGSYVPYKDFCSKTDLKVHLPTSWKLRQKWIVDYPSAHTSSRSATRGGVLHGGLLGP